MTATAVGLCVAVCVLALAASGLWGRGARAELRRRLIAGSVPPRVDGAPAGLLRFRVAGRVAGRHADLPPQEVLAGIGCGFVGGLLAGYLVAGVPGSAGGAVAGPLMADRIMLRVGGRHIAKLERQIPAALSLQARAVRAGRSVVDSMRTLAAEIPPPLGPWCASIARAVDVGTPFDEVLAAAGGFSDDTRVWTSALAIHARAGGNIAMVLDSLSDSLRERAHLRAEIRAMTAQARLSASVVAAAPLAFVVLAGLGEGPRGGVLGHPWLLGTGVALDAAGFFLMHRMLEAKL